MASAFVPAERRPERYQQAPPSTIWNVVGLSNSSSDLRIEQRRRRLGDPLGRLRTIRTEPNGSQSLLCPHGSCALLHRASSMSKPPSRGLREGNGVFPSIYSASSECDVPRNNIRVGPIHGRDVLNRSADSRHTTAAGSDSLIPLAYLTGAPYAARFVSVSLS